MAQGRACVAMGEQSLRVSRIVGEMRADDAHGVLSDFIRGRRAVLRAVFNFDPQQGPL